MLLWFVPCRPWCALLVRTWACYSESGQPRPRTEQRVNVRNRRPTCETAGSHAGHVEAQVAVAHSQSMTDHGAATHTGPRCSIHRNEANTTTHNSDFPAPHSRKVTTPATRYVHPPSWPQPTKTPTFPHQQAKKSPFQQHVVSYHPNFHPSQINAAIPTLSCHNSTRTTGELRATLLGNHANAALRTALRTDRPKNGPSTV